MKYKPHKFMRFVLRWFVTDKMRLTLAVTSLMESAAIRPNSTVKLTMTVMGKDVDWVDSTWEHTIEEDPHDDSKD